MINSKLQMFIWVLCSFIPTFLGLLIFKLFGNEIDSSYVDKYFFWGGMIRLLTIIFMDYIIAYEINSGNLSNYLVKPMSFLKYSLFRFLPGVLIKFILALPLFTFILLVSDLDISVGMTGEKWLLLIPLILCGYLITSGISYIIGILTFWLHSIDFLNSLNIAITTLLSGSIFPLFLFPRMFDGILKYSPFTYTLDFQLRILLSEETYSYGPFVIMIIWVITIWSIVKILYKLGL